jgi:hypothetical protein
MPWQSALDLSNVNDDHHPSLMVLTFDDEQPPPTLKAASAIQLEAVSTI